MAQLSPISSIEPAPAPTLAPETVSIDEFRRLFAQVYKVDFDKLGCVYHELVEHSGSGVSEIGEIAANRMQYIDEAARTLISENCELQDRTLSDLPGDSDFLAKVTEGFQARSKARPEMGEVLEDLESIEKFIETNTETDLALITAVWKKIDDLGMYNTGPGIHSAGRHEHRLTELRLAAEMLGSGDTEGARAVVQQEVANDLRAEIEEVPPANVRALLASYFGQMEELLKANDLPVVAGSLQPMMDMLVKIDSSVRIPVSCLDEHLLAENEKMAASVGTMRPKPDANFFASYLRGKLQNGGPAEVEVVLGAIEEDDIYVLSPLTGHALRVVPQDEFATLPASFVNQVGEIGWLSGLLNARPESKLEYRCERLTPEQLDEAKPFRMEFTSFNDNGTFSYVDARLVAAQKE